MRGWVTVTVTVAAAILLVAGCSSGAGDASSPTVAASPPATSRSTPAASTISPAAVRDWPTYHGTFDRAGIASLPASDRLTVAARLALDGAVYASPLVVGGLTIVATENNTVYAFDAAYRQVWKQHLGTPSPAAERPCGNIDPLGITGTPVYDTASGTLFVAIGLSAPVRHTLVSLDPHTGAVGRQVSLDFPGVDPTVMQERGALTVAGDRVWVPFGGLAGDCGDYKGRLVGWPTTGTRGPVVFTVPTTREAGIWTPPGPTLDGGRLLVAVGNGETGTSGPYDYSDSVLAIDTAGRRVDSFSPTTWRTDNENDLDLGSQGLALVGSFVFSAGKSGTAYVLARDHLGGIGGEVTEAPVCKSFGGTAVAGSTVFVPCADGVRAVVVSASGTMTVRWHAAESVSGSPVVGGGRVWTLDPDAGVLHALDQNSGASRAQVSVGATSRFATPAVRGADLLVPTLTGLTVVRVG